MRADPLIDCERRQRHPCLGAGHPDALQTAAKPSSAIWTWPSPASGRWTTRTTCSNCRPVRSLHPLNGPHSRVPVGQFKSGRIASTREPHLQRRPEDRNVSDGTGVREGMVAFAGYPLLVEKLSSGVVAMCFGAPAADEAS